MANRTMGGFRWRFNRYAPATTSPPIEILPVASAYATVLYVGDPVKKLSDGTIAAASAGDAVFGVFAGAEQFWDGDFIKKGGKLPVSTYGSNLSRQSLARVIPAKGQVFEADADDGTTATTQAAHQAFVGENCEWVAGSATGDQSGVKLDISTHATTNTLSVNLVNLAGTVDVDYAATGVKYLVEFNLIQAPGLGGTTGV